MCMCECSLIQHVVRHLGNAAAAFTATTVRTTPVHVPNRSRVGGYLVFMHSCEVIPGSLFKFGTTPHFSRLLTSQQIPCLPIVFDISHIVDKVLILEITFFIRRFVCIFIAFWIEASLSRSTNI